MDQEEHRPEPPPFRLTAGGGDVRDMLAEGHRVVDRDTGTPVNPGDSVIPFRGNGRGVPHSFMGLYNDKWNVPLFRVQDPQGNVANYQETDFKNHQILKPGEQWRHRSDIDFAPGSEDYRLLNHETNEEIKPGYSWGGYKAGLDGQPEHTQHVYRGIVRLPGSHSPGNIAYDSYTNGEYQHTWVHDNPTSMNATIAHKDDPDPPIYERGANGIYQRRDDTDPFSALEYLHHLSGERTLTTGDMGLLHQDAIDGFGQWYDSLPPDQRREYFEHPTIEAAWNDFLLGRGRAHHLWQGSGVGGRGGGEYGHDDTLMDRYVNKQTKNWDPDRDAFDPREFGI